MEITIRIDGHMVSIEVSAEVGEFWEQSKRSNPHAHIMLTIRPLKPDGRWGPKCRKVYDLDSQGKRIPDGKGGWKNHREDSTDWNNRENAEKWRAAWAAYANRALGAAGRPERIDHRSYKRQGVEKIPSIHMGSAASQMERRGIATDKGNINRQIAADNKLLKEIKARITRLYNWTKEQAEIEPRQDGGSLMARLYEAQVNSNKARSRSGKIKALQDNAKLFAFLQSNDIKSMQELYEKVSAMKLVIAIMSKGHFTSSGHFIVLRGVTADGKLLVADPASVKRSNQAWDLNIVVNEATLTILVPVGGFGLIGISDDSLTRWLGCWWRWRKNRRLIFYRGECKK